jgi:hypothetical protein
MKRFAGMVFAVLAASSTPCWADTAKQFLQLYYSEDGQGQDLAVVKIGSMEAGVHQANEYLKAHNQTPIYCQPPQLVLTAPQVADMIHRAAEEKDSKVKDMTVSASLLFVLQRTFPCTAEAH